MNINGNIHLTDQLTLGSSIKWLMKDFGCCGLPIMFDRKWFEYSTFAVASCKTPAGQLPTNLDFGFSWNICQQLNWPQNMLHILSKHVTVVIAVHVFHLFHSETAVNCIFFCLFPYLQNNQKCIYRIEFRFEFQRRINSFSVNLTLIFDIDSNVSTNA